MNSASLVLIIAGGVVALVLLGRACIAATKNTRWDTFAKCPCGWFMHAPFGNLSHNLMFIKCCPRCGFHAPNEIYNPLGYKQDWRMVSMRKVNGVWKERDDA